MNTRVLLTAVYEPVENGWIQARIAEIPGVITAGETPDEARELLLDALREYLLSLADGSDSPATADGATKEPLEVTLSAQVSAT